MNKLNKGLSKQTYSLQIYFVSLKWMSVHKKWVDVQAIDMASMMSHWCDTDKKERTYIDTIIIYTLWYEFQNDFDAQSDFGKNFVTKKLLLSYILDF